jgi:Gluconate 2-dehydrogenase subunit 3
VTLAARRDLLAVVLDTLVPASGGFPGAGAIALDHVLVVAAGAPEIDALLSGGLGAIEEAARAASDAGLAPLDQDARERLLRRVEQSHPVFFDALVRHAYDGYYSHPTIVARLGLEPGPVHPRGHRLAGERALDLAHITARGPLYRRA